jgi:gas vesicle protein
MDIIGLIIGLAVGGAAVWFIQQNKITELKQQLEERKKEVQNWEETHETRLREMRTDLEAENKKKLTQAIEDLNQKHQAEIKALEAAKTVSEVTSDQRQEEVKVDDTIGDVWATETTVNETISVTETSSQETEIKTQKELNLSDLAPHIPQQEVILVAEELTETEAEIEEILTEVVAEIPETPEELREENVELNDLTPTVISEKLEIVINPKLDITEKILALGNSEKSANILQLKTYLYHSDSQIRSLVAIAMGNIAESGNIQRELQETIFSLEKLAKDPNNTVRYAAIEALGKIKSEKIIPLLQIALKDTDPEVVKCASQTLNRFKGYQITHPKTILKPRLQKIKK